MGDIDNPAQWKDQFVLPIKLALMPKRREVYLKVGIASRVLIIKALLYRKRLRMHSKIFTFPSLAQDPACPVAAYPYVGPLVAAAGGGSGSRAADSAASPASSEHSYFPYLCPA